MSDLAALLVAFRDVTGAEAAIWEVPREGTSWSLLAASSDDFRTRSSAIVSAPEPDVAAHDAQCALWRTLANDCVVIAEANKGDIRAAGVMLVRSVGMAQRIIRERDAATRELSERYEEMNLLYAVGKLLGGDIPVEISAGTMLRELALTIGASRAAFLLADKPVKRLLPIATIGLKGKSYPVIDLADPDHIAARVFRTGTAASEAGDAACTGDALIAGDAGAILAVAITRASNMGDVEREHDADDLMYRTRETPIDTSPLGVVLFGGRDASNPFSAGDRKLVLAVAAQLGTALHNASLMRQAMEREHLAREMRLAHDLQLKLLPNPNVVGPEARAAARVVPAESVGGDFFLLTRLDAKRTGVLIGDVSGHGYQAALVMALALSAAAIHVRAADNPAETLEEVSRSLGDELESTEMSLSLCYAVIDEDAGEVRYANAGHPHVFQQRADGTLHRLSAQALPLGFVADVIRGDAVTWNQGDRLVCFTDGIVDACDASGRRLGEAAVLNVVRDVGQGETPGQILDRIFDLVTTHRAGEALTDDLTAVVVDRRGPT